jgi:hypothetical protein
VAGRHPCHDRRGVRRLVPVRARQLGSGVESVQAFTAIPFSGVVDAVRLGWWPERNAVAAVFGIASLALAVYIVVRTVRRRNVVMCAALPMALVYPFYDGTVIHTPQDSSRALGASVTFLLLDVMVERTTGRRDAPVLDTAPT